LNGEVDRKIHVAPLADHSSHLGEGVAEQDQGLVLELFVGSFR